MKISFFGEKFRFYPPQNRAGMTLVEVVIALAISVMLIAGIASGYIYCVTLATKADLAQVASAKALERLEQARTAIWDISSWPVVDELVATNFPDEQVTLDMPGTNSSGTTAIIQTTIAQFSSNPPAKLIHVDCIWNFRGTEPMTNSIETCRAPDQ